MNDYTTLTSATANDFMHRLRAFADANPHLLTDTEEQRGETPAEAAARKTAAAEHRVAAWRKFMATDHIREQNLLPDRDHGFSDSVSNDIQQALSGNNVIWIQGNPGVGKTALALAIGNYYADCGQVPYFTEFATAYSTAMFFGPRYPEREKFFTKCENADLLILDDFGSTDPHPNALAAVNELLDLRRANPYKITIATSNQPFEQLLNDAQTNGKAEWRVLDRLKGVQVTYRGTSMR